MAAALCCHRKEPAPLAGGGSELTGYLWHSLQTCRNLQRNILNTVRIAYAAVRHSTQHSVLGKQSQPNGGYTRLGPVQLHAHALAACRSVMLLAGVTL